VCVDIETMACQAITNDSANASGGAGINAAKTVIDAGAQAVLTGNCGPNAFRTLTAGGIAVYTGLGGTVQEAVEQFKSGKLTPDQDASVDSHSGTGA
jgi:predicted Fe-Mo cluster-binding NifX family protein